MIAALVRILSALVLVSLPLTVSAQTAPPPANVAATELRQLTTDARTEIDAYLAAGGALGAPDHPAVKWDAALWEFRQRNAGTEAAAMAAVEATRLLVRAELWDRAHARIDSIDVDDPTWQRLAYVVYEVGIARKDLPYAVEHLSRVAAATRIPAIKAAVLVAMGRAHRRAGDPAAATSALEAARAAAPGSAPARDAEGLIYEIEHLSVGMPAPAIVGKARNGGTVDLAAFRGKAVVVIFWGST